MEVASGDINLYRYAFNRPLTWKDPSGLEIVIFVHGSNSSPSVFDKSFLSIVKRTLGAEGHVLFKWSGTTYYDDMQKDASRFCSFVNYVKLKHPLEPIYVVAHSNGGNVATLAANYGAPIDVIVRLGSPTLGAKFPNYTNVPATTLVFNFYDPDDSVAEFYAVEFRGAVRTKPSATNWCNIQIEAGSPGLLTGGNVHTNLRSAAVWSSQIAPYLEWIRFLDPREWFR